MPDPESHTLAYLRRIDENLDRQHAETGARLDQIADELLVLNGIVLRLEGREVEATGLKGDPRPARALAWRAGAPPH